MMLMERNELQSAVMYLHRQEGRWSSEDIIWKGNNDEGSNSGPDV